MPLRYIARSKASVAVIRAKGVPYVSFCIAGDTLKTLRWTHGTCLVCAWDSDLRHLQMTSGSDSNHSARSINIRGGQAGEVRWALLLTWESIIPDPLSRTSLPVLSTDGGSLVLDLSQLPTPNKTDEHRPVTD